MRFDLPHISLLTPPGTSLRRAVFLDRDGTLNVEKDYLYKIEDFEFLPGVFQALKRLREAGFALVVVTNQSGVARGYYTLEQVDILHRHMYQVLSSEGIFLDGIYCCPHHPDVGRPPFDIDCNCRKGKPGMLLQAARDLNLDLGQSYMIGDKRVDLKAGERAGCRSLLVLTGYGEDHRQFARSGGFPVFNDLACAGQHILRYGRLSSCNN